LSPNNSPYHTISPEDRSFPLRVSGQRQHI
jgi:hypothetical protein